VFTIALHWSLSWTRSIQSIPPHPLSLRSVIILSTHVCLVFQVVSFLLAFPPVICIPVLHIIQYKVQFSTSSSK
jgi:hypothetical protein